MNPIGPNNATLTRTGPSSLSLEYNKLASFITSIWAQTSEDHEPDLKRYSIYTLKAGEVCFCLDGVIETKKIQRIDTKIKHTQRDILELEKKIPRLTLGSYKNKLKKKLNTRQVNIRLLQDDKKEIKALEGLNWKNIFVAHDGKHPGHIRCILDWLTKKDKDSNTHGPNCLHREEDSSRSLKDRCYVCRDKIDKNALIDLYNQQQIPLEEKRIFTYRAQDTHHKKTFKTQTTLQKIETISKGALVAGFAAAMGLLHLKMQENPALALQAGLTHRPIFIGAAKIGLFLIKELWGKLSENENQKLQTLATGILTGVFLITLNTPGTGFSEKTKDALAIAVIGLSIIASIAFTYLDAEEQNKLDKMTAQSVLKQASKITLIALATDWASTAFKDPQQAIAAIGAATLIGAIASTH